MLKAVRVMFAVAAAVVMCAGASAQSVKVDAREVEATRVQMTAMRDAFVKAVHDAGFTCPIAAPKLLIVDVPSFGSYEPSTNELKTSSWTQMTDGERALFHKFMGPNSTDEMARAEFEDGAHHWVFVHEMGHWWQECQKVSNVLKPYALEFGADRIAAAYWKEHDPSVIEHQRAVFEAIVTRWPNPVPEGQNAEAYFNINYEQLGPTPGYIWFQAHMCLKAYDEKPAPSFAQALRETK